MVVALTTAESSPQGLNRGIGRSIAEHRSRAGYSIGDFAAMVGIKYERYKTIEYGRYRISAIDCWRIADALNIGIDELIGRPVPKKGCGVFTADADQVELLECFRNSDDEQKRALLLTARAFSGEATGREGACSTSGREP